MPWLQTGATHYHAQLGLQDKGHVTKWLVFCYVVWLGLLKRMGLRTSASCMGLVPCCGHNGYRIIELKYRNTPYTHCSASYRSITVLVRVIHIHK